ncbi:hypothetical protein KDH_01650 [Dictyobacter sp. S3.2.2.5]|uniref:Transposase DDE domain-containing protein n=1 Tax=Dictyobacter halimunensis TaxID=3026934 RepID=A0ABQ6FLN8_9CHLR|nr:hypothetical protein KDH_01650 [Dictyobacter sp. S3.2.2.5]
MNVSLFGKGEQIFPHFSPRKLDISQCTSQWGFQLVTNNANKFFKVMLGSAAEPFLLLCIDTSLFTLMHNKNDCCPCPNKPGY